MADDVNKFMRDFNRFTGDGLPNEPKNAPLPVGSAKSGPYVPTKSDLRAWAEAIQLETEAGNLLNVKITAEEAARIAADNAIALAASSESTARIAGDGNLQTQIANLAAGDIRIVGPAFDASSGAFPTSAQYAGVTRAVQAGDTFRVSVSGTISGQPFVKTDTITAIKNAPSASVYATNWQIGKSSEILNAADVRPFLTEAAMLAATDVVANQRAQVAGHEWIYKALGTYTASPTVKDGAAFQAVSTSLVQGCTFAEDTRTIAFLRSVHGSSATVMASFDGCLQLLDLAQTGAQPNTTGGGVKLYPLTINGDYSFKSFGIYSNETLDQTSRIQVAIDTVSAAAGPTNMLNLLVEAGVYRHGSIVVKPGVVLLGKGAALKVRDSYATSAGVAYYPIADTSDGRAGLRNIVLDGNSANNTLYAVCDSLTLVGTNSFADNLEIRDAIDSGVMFSGADGAWIDKIRILGARDVGVYVNNSSGSSPDSEGGYIGRVWAYDCVFSAVAYKRSTTRIHTESIFAKRCGNAVAFEDFGAGSGGSPFLLTVGQIEAYDIGYMHRASGAAETLITANAAHNVYIGSVIGRNISGTAFNCSGSSNFVISHFDVEGYITDPQTGGLYKNSGIVLFDRSGVASSNVKVLSGCLSGFAENGVSLISATNSKILLENVTATKLGLYVTSSVSECVLTGRYDGGTTDLSFVDGAFNINLSGCFFPDQTGDIAQHGGRRNASVISPYGVTLPRYIGELFSISASSQTFIAAGLANTDWVQLGSKYRIVSASAIASASDSINAQGKHESKLVWDATNQRLMRSDGASATSSWRSVGGGVTVVPA